MNTFRKTEISSGILQQRNPRISQSWQAWQGSELY